MRDKTATALLWWSNLSMWGELDSRRRRWLPWILSIGFGAASGATNASLWILATGVFVLVFITLPIRFGPFSPPEVFNDSKD